MNEAEELREVAARVVAETPPSDVFGIALESAAAGDPVTIFLGAWSEEPASGDQTDPRA